MTILNVNIALYNNVQEMHGKSNKNFMYNEHYFIGIHQLNWTGDNSLKDTFNFLHLPRLC